MNIAFQSSTIMEPQMSAPVQEKIIESSRKSIDDLKQSTTDRRISKDEPISSGAEELKQSGQALYFIPKRARSQE